MVCTEAEAAEPAAEPQAGQVAKAQPACAGDVMCPLHKSAVTASARVDQSGGSSIAATSTQQESTGAICLLSPDGKGGSIAAIGFIYGPPCAVQDFESTDPVAFAPVEFSSITYDDASTPLVTPPPRA